MRAFTVFCLSLLIISSSLLADDEPAPTLAEVSYGPHASNVLDFWMAEGDGPRPLLVYIHGGGWRGGDKQRNAASYLPFLEQGVSYAAVNYRLSGEAPLPAPVHDAARAIQFIRSKAAEWNINPDRIALTGGSAGACSSMWILLHDDLADPEADDPVLRQSTRVTAAAVSGGQTSIDPMVIEPWLGPKVLEHSMIWTSVGAESMAAALEDYDQYRELYEEFSPYNHLDAEDPPLFMTYGNNMTLPSENAGHGIHHPVYGVKMKEQADQLGHECYLLISGVSAAEPYGSANEFLLDQLLAPSESVGPAADPESDMPLQIEETFESADLSRWISSDPAAWRIDVQDANHVLSQFRQSDVQTPARSPFNRAFVRGLVVTDFQLDVDLRSTARDYPHRSLCLFFGYQDPAHFYYVHLGQRTDDHANQIFIVNEAPRTKISERTTEGTPWDDAWHHVRITRDVESGIISVYFDDLDDPDMVATDRTFTWGAVGIGSFDDTGDFDNFVLYGRTRR